MMDYRVPGMAYISGDADFLSAKQEGDGRNFPRKTLNKSVRPEPVEGHLI
jgi:hypothetical protein